MKCNSAYPVMEAQQRNGAKCAEVKNETRTYLEYIEIKYTKHLNVQALKLI